jgi:oxygen-independent coproporphyrinogen-3 oxidase
MAGLYIHVPFCVKRCVYCDFFSDTQAALYKELYLTAVVEEMALRRGYIDGETLETVYIGGGTPSVLAVADFEKVFDSIYRLFSVKEGAEITLEVNPDDLTPAYVLSLVRLPFNRISMGVQSFNDRDLRLLSRRHNARKAIEAVRLCQELGGYDNLSIDLMYGLPGQTTAMWEDNLREALRLETPHISAYHLTYERNTPLYRMKEEGRIRPVDEEVSKAMFELLTSSLSEAGYLHYEISNFARPGHLSLHNSGYWTGKKYLGLGPSAHSYDTQSRQWNVSSLSRYVEGIRKSLPEVESERLDEDAKYNEYILTGLRCRQGISIAHILTAFGERKYLYSKEQAKAFIDGGMLCEEGDRLRLSKRGAFVSDNVIRSLFWVDNYTKRRI